MTFFPKEFASSTQLWTQPVSNFTLKDFLQTLHGSADDEDDGEEVNDDDGDVEDDDDDDGQLKNCSTDGRYLTRTAQTFEIDPLYEFNRHKTAINKKGFNLYQTEMFYCEEFNCSHF